MEQLLEFLDPTLDPAIWVGRVVGLFLFTYLLVWLAALILCRLRWFINYNSTLLKVYFAWLIPLACQAVFFTILLLFSIQYARRWGISPWYSFIYFAPLLVTVLSGFNLSTAIKEKLRAKGV